jgi:hypothetical protein
VRLLIDENLPPRRASTPARGRLRETAHAAEVDLHLPAGVAVGHPHRRLLAAVPQLLDAEAVQRPLRNHHAAAGQQIDDLDHRHVRLQPRLDALRLGVAAFPRRTAPAGPGRADRLHHRAQQLVGQLLLAAVTHHTGSLGRLHVPADRLTLAPLLGVIGLP